MHLKSLVLLTLLSVTLSGCSTVKGWLRPWVCDCENHMVTTNGTPPEHLDSESGDDHEHDEHENPESGDHADELTDAAPDVTETDVNDEQANTPLTPTWTALTALDQSSERERLKKAYIVKGDVTESTLALEGRFSLKAQPAVAIVNPGKSIEVYSESARLAQSAFDLTPAPAEFGPFVQGLELVKDGRLELVVIGVRQDVAGRREVVYSVWKVIGTAVARTFERPIAEEQNGKWVRTAQVEVLNGAKNRFLRVTPVDRTQPTETYRWNRWEGLFRVPTPAPTAPHRAMLDHSYWSRPT